VPNRAGVVPDILLVVRVGGEVVDGREHVAFPGGGGDECPAILHRDDQGVDIKVARQEVGMDAGLRERVGGVYLHGAACITVSYCFILVEGTYERWVR